METGAGPTRREGRGRGLGAGARARGAEASGLASGLGAAVQAGRPCCPTQNLRKERAKDLGGGADLWCQEGLEFNPLKGELLSAKYRLPLLDAHRVQGASHQRARPAVRTEPAAVGLSLGWSEAEALPTPGFRLNP